MLDEEGRVRVIRVLCRVDVLAAAAVDAAAAEHGPLGRIEAEVTRDAAGGAAAEKAPAAATANAPIRSLREERRCRSILRPRARVSSWPMVAPVLPRLTDSFEDLDGLLAQIADAGATGVTVFGLHLRSSTRGWFMAWLAKSHPELVDEYRELYRRGAYLPSDYKKMLHDRVTPLVAKYGLSPDRRSVRVADVSAAPPVEVLQPTLF